jgi:hypothetical protein
MRYETVTIYRDKKKDGRLIVQPMARHPTGASAEFGEPTELLEEQVEARLLHVVLENLEKYHGQTYVPEHAPKYSGKGYADFTRRHDMVSVTRVENGVVEVNASERVRGGYRGLNSEMIVLQPHDVPTQLVSAIRRAFDLCS